MVLLSAGKPDLLQRASTNSKVLIIRRPSVFVVKPSTVRLVISLAIQSGWALHQLYVQNAFLHGYLTEDIFMAQPPDFTHLDYPQHVCKLQKALYGLKHAPRA